MNWKHLFSPVQSMKADEVKVYMAQHPEGSYTLLDVRQPGEYAREHIPGAQLIPLPEIASSLSKLNPENPVIAY